MAQSDTSSSDRFAPTINQQPSPIIMQKFSNESEREQQLDVASLRGGVLFVILLSMAGLWLGCSSEEERCFGTAKSYVVGTVYQDGCRDCTCNEDTTITCVETTACSQTCTDSDGMPHAIGDFWSAGDSCNLCECASDLTIECTNNDCGIPCTYAGEQRAPGSMFPADDGCNTCDCGADGTVSCTELPCSN